MEQKVLTGKDGSLTINVHDAVNHPLHYTNDPSGVECITIAENWGFNLGNALKYLWRCNLKNNAIEDLDKAIFYIQREKTKRLLTKI